DHSEVNEENTLVFISVSIMRYRWGFTPSSADGRIAALQAIPVLWSMQARWRPIRESPPAWTYESEIRRAGRKACPRQRNGRTVQRRASAGLMEDCVSLQS